MRILPVLVFLALLGLIPANAAAESSLWEMSPYQVQVLLAVDGAPELTPALAADLRTTLSHRLGQWMGARWQAKVSLPPPALRWRMLAGMNRLTFELVPKELLAGDKLFAVAIQPDPNGYRVSARELDLRTQIWNTPVSLCVGHPSGLGQGAFAAIEKAFAPLGQVGTVEHKEITLRFRGSKLPTGDPTVLKVRPGDVFQAAIRKSDREGKTRSVSIPPWTFLEAEKAVVEGVKCKLHTGIGLPLNPRARGRTEQVALKVIPPGGATTLVLQARTEPKQPLIGYDVYFFGEGADPKALQFHARSDCRGHVAIPHTARTLRDFLVKHGEEILVRLPVVPGLHPKLEVSLRNDDDRLQIEGDIRGLHEKLVDLVTGREVLLAWSRKLLDAPDQQEYIPTLLEQLDAFKLRQAEYNREVASIRTRAISNDPSVQKKIDAMFAELDKAIAHHGDASPIGQMTDQLRDAKKAP
jgi:hypothetical protein